MTARLHMPKIFGHRAAVPAEIPAQPLPGALLAPVDERVAQIEAAFPYAHVTVDPHFVLGECGWCCPTIPEPASVRVYGDPRHDDRVNQPLEMVEVCQRCAVNPRGPIWQAAVESKTSADIRVEVSA
ncbi:hypothetical protein ACWEF6_02915 [Amycolatopsis sp. NPDC004772]